MSASHRDYAIVAWFSDINTGRVAIVAAGVGRRGTITAGELLTNPGDLALYELAALVAGGKKNLEIALSTQIIDGGQGTPRMEASPFWDLRTQVFRGAFQSFSRLFSQFSSQG